MSAQTLSIKLGEIILPQTNIKGTFTADRQKVGLSLYYNMHT